MEKILGFFGEYKFLSNFWQVEIEYEGLKYQSTEAAYQAAKTLDKDIRLTMSKMNAFESKEAGKNLNIRKDWEQVKVRIMRELLIKKFKNPELKEKLLATKNAYLEETNTWNDKFWGVCNNEGQNILGKLLMEVRNNI